MIWDSAEPDVLAFSRCPSRPGLVMRVVDLLLPGNDWLRTAGELMWADHGLYLAFRDGPAVRVAVWCPRLGWRECRGATPSLGPMPAGPLGVSMAAVALGPGPHPGVAPWLEGILSDPAALHLALSVMRS